MKHEELSHQFEDLVQQRESATLGMWVFLATEVLFFGGMFAAYTIYRVRFPEVFADCSRQMDLWMGALNTAVLLTSSFTMVLAVHAAERGNNRAIVRWIVLTWELRGWSTCINFKSISSRDLIFLSSRFTASLLKFSFRFILR
jgi:cytochrome c oxidase subunit 3